MCGTITNRFCDLCVSFLLVWYLQEAASTEISAVMHTISLVCISRALTKSVPYLWGGDGRCTASVHMFWLDLKSRTQVNLDGGGKKKESWITAHFVQRCRMYRRCYKNGSIRFCFCIYGQHIRLLYWYKICKIRLNMTESSKRRWVVPACSRCQELAHCRATLYPWIYRRVTEQRAIQREHMVHINYQGVRR